MQITSSWKRNWSEAVAGNSQLRAPLPKSSQYDLFWEKYYKYGIDAAFKATVYKKVCKRYYKEYPIILLKSIIKKCICWDRKIQWEYSVNNWRIRGLMND